MALDAAVLERVVSAALREDLDDAGDLTTDAVIEADRISVGRIVARQDLVLAGLPVAREVFRRLDNALEFDARHTDGDAVPGGSVVAAVRGHTRSILQGERTALNFLQRMSGIASLTREAVNEIAGTDARILDTRKTAPGLRSLDKYAVAAGGGTNHRMGLFDAVIIKDTHLDAGCSIGEAVRRVLERGHAPSIITVEVRDLDELQQALDSGAGRALLDNLDPETMREAVRRASGRMVLEASGGLRPGNLREVAETGVDFLSLGWLTHSVSAADLAMEMEPAS
jgi:nicotinate-nucleotide pyrophosphorylase (carboxylating)